MSCGCSRSVNITAPVAAKMLSATRETCLLCMKKHLGCAGIVIESSSGTSSDVLLGRAQILMGEALQGYPWHRSYAVACLALIAESITLSGGDSTRIKDAQYALEAGGPWIRPELENIQISFSPGLAAAHLAEAAAECPKPRLKRAMELDTMILANNPTYQSSIERWLKDVS